MSDETRTPDDAGHDEVDAKAAEEAVVKAIEETVEKPSSIEEEMLEEAAELAEGAVPAVQPEPAAPVEHPPPDDEVLAELAAAFPQVRWDDVAGQDEAYVPADAVVAFAEAARDAGYSTFIDLCAVDYLRRAPRFDVVTHLVDTERPHRLRFHVGAEAADPVVPSITSVFPGANFYEREAYDLFGIVFTGHTDLTRILLPDDWEGHPLRKDYAVGSVPVQFKGSHQAT